MPIKGIFIYILITAILSISFIYSRSIFGLIFSLILFVFICKKLGEKALLVSMITFIFFAIYRVNTKPNIKEEYIEKSFVVLEDKESYSIVKKDNIKYLIYIEEKLDKYDEIRIKGNISEIQKDLNIDVFEFKDYLNNKRVFYQIDIYEYKVIKNNKWISKNIVSFLTSKLENESLSMTKMLMFNDSSTDINAYDNLKDINKNEYILKNVFDVTKTKKVKKVIEEKEFNQSIIYLIYKELILKIVLKVH